MPTDLFRSQFVERLSQARNRALEAGVSEQELDSETMFEPLLAHVAASLAKTFKVSTQVIERRLRLEKLP